MPQAILQYSEIARFHRDYYLANRPVVIRGVRESRSLKVFSWSVEYFAPIIGNARLPVMQTQTGFLSYERDFVDMTFREFAGRVFEPDLHTGARYYFKNPTQFLPSDHDDSRSVDGLRTYLERSRVSNLWISGRDLTVGLHFDAADNLNFQLKGRKAFWLFPPGIDPYYPLPMFSQTAHISGVFRDGASADLGAFPKFDPSAGTRIVLEEGDVLYLPAYWWHQVESLGYENVNLNFWWFPTLGKQLRNWNQALRGHAQMALRYLKYGNIQQAPSTARGDREKAV